MLKYKAKKINTKKKEGMKLNILAVGDIVGEAGIRKLKEELPKIKKQENIDFVITNGENSAGGMGITEKNFRDILSAGTDVITLGNHTWAKKEIFKFIDEPQILRPANYPEGVPGKGYNIFECNNKKIAVMNYMGRVDINILTENPFVMAKKDVEEVSKEADIIIMDFHAEATAEKIAMGRFLDGKITILFGTHTHVQTADEQIFPQGTAYITDLGMTGPKNSVIGMDVQVSFKRFETALPEKYKIAEGECILNAVKFEIDDNTNKVTAIKKIFINE